MKKLTLLFAFFSFSIVFAQKGFDYPSKWEHIDHQESNGEVKSLLPEVETIYQQAIRDDNFPQQLKAFFYKSKISLRTSEDDDVKQKIMRDFTTKFEGVNDSEQAILQSLEAQLYALYYQRNQYKIDQRTESEEEAGADFRYWSKTQFLKKITDLYDQSLHPEKELQKKPIADWAVLLKRQTETENLRPTLYDFVAHRALAFFTNSHYFSTSVEMKKKEKAVEIYNNLIAFHQTQNDLNSLAYNKLELLKLTHKTLGKEKFKKKLIALTTEFPHQEYTPYILLEVANFYRKQFEETDSNNFARREELAQKAIDYSKQILRDFRKSEPAKSAENIEKYFTFPDFHISVENYISPNQVTPIAVSYKNLTHLYFKVFTYKKESEKLLREFSDAQEKEQQKKLDQIFKKLSQVEVFELDLKQFEDHQIHTTIGKMATLKPGHYLVFASNNPNFKINSEKVEFIYHEVYVSPYALAFLNNHILLTNRETGKPVKNKNIDIYKTRNRQSTKIKTVKTNKLGLAYYKNDESVYLKYKVEGDDSYFYNYYFPHSSSDKTLKRTTFFTDRKIYRPGQTLYFKAISYTESPDYTRNVSAGKSVIVTLKDVNRKTVAKQTLKSNEFGAVSGEFVLPTSGLTGQYALSSSYDNRSPYSSAYHFNVEEYKRPKFEVSFDKVDGIYKLNEEICTKGRAQSYSGAHINNAKVVYRVYRERIYPYLPWWRKGYFPISNAKVAIAHNETFTDKDGNFEVEFKAIPGTSTAPNFEREKKENRTFRYTIKADITDLNGETHSAEQTITVGDLRYILDVPISDQINIASFDSIPISIKNLNGQKVSAKGNVSLTKIKAPDRVLRKSPFPNTDYELYPKEEFIQYFPNEPYANENEKENWEKGTEVLNAFFNTRKKTAVPIQAKKWESGYYILEAHVLDGKDTIKQEKLVYLTHSKEKKPVDNELFSVTLDKDQYQPGDIAVVSFSSAAKQAKVLVNLEVKGEIVKSNIVNLQDNIKTFRFPIKEGYRGNVFVHYYFGKFNSEETGTLTVNVPHKDRSLKITTKTFRNKLKPGQDETWELTVSGKDKDKFLAEMLATMYDASLDQFKSNSIKFPLGNLNNSTKLGSWNALSSFGVRRFSNLLYHYYSDFSSGLQFDKLNWSGLDSYFGYGYMRGLRGNVMGLKMVKEEKESVPASPSAPETIRVRGENARFNSNLSDKISQTVENQNKKNSNPIMPRRALQETAFFYPDLRTDKEGNVKIRFTVPESLTTWKFMAMVHTKDLRTAYLKKKVITQKELMVTPNPPRFLREGDEMKFSSKITNLSDKDLTGETKLLLFDAFTMQPVDKEFHNNQIAQNFTVSKGESTTVSWNFCVPEAHRAIVYRVVAAAGDFSDGEENALPVLTNRKLVTETLPIHIREGQDKTFMLDKLKNNHSESLDNFNLTFEITTNPIWQAIFSLPYLREPSYDNSISNFGQLYGNMISAKLVNSNPKIKAVFEDWKSKDQLKSKLEQNQALKELLLEETPWVREAESEEEQMKRVSLMFDMNKMKNERRSSFHQLKEKQSVQGGFPWFPGGNDNRYITTYIVSGLGHLKVIGIDLDKEIDGEIQVVLKNAIRYLDRGAIKVFENKAHNENYKINTYEVIQYLYARSSFLDQFPLPQKAKQLKDDFLKELARNKFELPLQSQAMAATVLERYDQHTQAVQLLESVKDRAVNSDEMGMYWKSNKPGWIWQKAPVETQALLIEAFDEILKDVESVESMKVWLLKNRQTHRWISVKATTEAVYALLNTGKEWLNSEEGIQVKIGGRDLGLKTQEKQKQAGSGYIKTSWHQSEIKPEMGVVEVKKTSPGVAWGALYWQYFENLDKITSAETGIQFEKELFLKKNTDRGQVLRKITENTPVQVGDLVTVRLKIQTDRDMQFVHVKDMRASGFEPSQVISRYKYQDGLAYYESTRDAATNFFMDSMPKGAYVFEYDLRANNAGDFSNGITTMQNMYAPELNARSKGIRVVIQ